MECTPQSYVKRILRGVPRFVPERVIEPVSSSTLGDMSNASLVFAAILCCVVSCAGTTPEEPGPPSVSARTAIMEQAASAYEEGDYEASIPLLSEACESGEMEACTYLGWAYRRGEGVPKDRPRGAELYRRACEGGHSTGCTNLAALYQTGDGRPNDYSKAKSLYERACEGGSMRACATLGWMYGVGERANQDWGKRSLVPCLKACQAGEMRGCTCWGVVARREGAVRAEFLERACEGGDMRGCHYLGMLYKVGDGVAQDTERAATLYARACKGGEAAACR